MMQSMHPLYSNIHPTYALNVASAPVCYCQIAFQLSW
eukprot:COSAG06_NODE_267_length_18822_cov_26.254607_7_plen_37_part_00